jgi:DNA-directed RNA polymerase alpha subunit
MSDRTRISKDFAENTETISSPITNMSGAKPQPLTSLPDMPSVSNIQITSAVAGVLSEDEGSKSTTTRRVETLTCDIDRITAPIANMFRRVFSTEVPTVAIDRVLIEENDGVVLDELLSHRLGLVPIAAPVDRMAFITNAEDANFNKLDGSRVLVFDLDIRADPHQAITPVYSRHLRWVPLAGQEEWGEEVFLVHHDILLAKLGPNQRIKLRAIAIKGLALVHAKWSPVSACYYEFRNEISLSRPLRGDDAKLLRRLCPMKVFDIEDDAAFVNDPRSCTLCRECLRNDQYPTVADAVTIEKHKTSVHFTLETTGQLRAKDVFVKGLQLFAERLRGLAAALKASEVNVIASNS